MRHPLTGGAAAGRCGLSFAEIVLASSLLLVVLVPLGTLLSRSTADTRTSIEEFHASLLLTELMGQAASLPWERLPETSEALDLSATETARLDAALPTSAVHLSPLRTGVLARSLSIRSLSAAGGGLKQLRGTVRYRRANGQEKTLEMVTCVGRIR